MSEKFEEFDFVVLNETNTNGRFSSEDTEIVDSIEIEEQPQNVIRVFDLDDDGEAIEFTYDKLFEILEARTDGLKPEIWY